MYFDFMKEAIVFFIVMFSTVLIIYGVNYLYFRNIKKDKKTKGNIILFILAINISIVVASNVRKMIL